MSDKNSCLLFGIIDISIICSGSLFGLILLAGVCYFSGYYGKEDMIGAVVLNYNTSYNLTVDAIKLSIHKDACPILKQCYITRDNSYKFQLLMSSFDTTSAPISVNVYEGPSCSGSAIASGSIPQSILTFYSVVPDSNCYQGPVMSVLPTETTLRITDQWSLPSLLSPYMSLSLFLLIASMIILMVFRKTFLPRATSDIDETSDIPIKTCNYYDNTL